MTSTQTPEKAADTTREPLPAEVVGHDAMYDALRGLLRVSRAVIRDVEKNSADYHRDMDALRDAVQVGLDLLYPPPLPEFPEDATVLYAHAVEPKDRLFIRGRWAEVLHVEDETGPQGQKRVRFIFRSSEVVPPHHFDVLDPLPVIRHTTPDTQEPSE